MIFSIDQNCHSLWDVLPKLQVLARKGHRIRHFIEDVDVAFTAMGAVAPAQPSTGANGLRLALERFHRSGGADWGAAMFYSEFLGRLPVEVRDLEPMLGMKTKVLARQLNRTVDDLYDELSPGDNWQLIGPSYVGNESYHRIIGDLGVSETAEFLRGMIDKAQDDTLERFPSPQSRQRVTQWFARERVLVESLLARHSGGRLVELYRDWLAAYPVPGRPQVELDFASRLLACAPGAGHTAPLEIFTKDYDRAAGLYNDSLAESDSRLRPLRTADGELPFFATLKHTGHLVRAAVQLNNGKIRIAGPDGPEFELLPGGRLPLAKMSAAGVESLAGKAIVLTIQVRLSPGGAPLALPYRGSLYMPASSRLAEKLAAAGLLPGRLHPVIRVRLHLLERLRGLETPVRLPDHLAACFGCEEVPARKLGDNYEALAAEAARRLESFRNDQARREWQRRTFPQIFRQIDELDAVRRSLAAQDPKGPRIREISKQVKALEQTLLRETLLCVWRDYQVSQLDYWDSRGAILPWCVALGGEDFYNQVVAQAEVYEEA